MRAGWGMRLGAVLPAVVLWLAGCSDTSRLNMYVDSIKGVDGTNVGKSYIEADIVGGPVNYCLPIQDQASVTVKLEQPGTVGPTLSGYVTGYRIDYYYYHPENGSLQGPVTWMSSDQAVAHQPVSTSVVFTVPVVTFEVKAWAVGLACPGIPVHQGVANIQRVLARVTVLAEDATGKKLSAQGSITVYLNDYAPARLAGDTCVVMTAPAYWSAVTNCK